MLFKKKCPICGAKNNKERIVCIECGAPFASREVEGRLAKVETKKESQFSTRIDCEKLCLAISQVVFAASSDSSKEVLTGVMAEFEGYKLTLAAADGFRLAVHRTSLTEPVAEKVAIIIPAADLQELNRYLVNVKETIDVEGNLQANQVVFRTSGKQVISQLVKGKYPDYGRFLPSGYDTRASFLTSKLSKIISGFPVTDSEASKIVRLQMVPTRESEEGKVVVVVASEPNRPSTAAITAEVEGKENRIAFNRSYLTEGLSAISEEKATLDVVNPSSPGVIRPVGAENYIYVLMPMFVQW